MSQITMLLRSVEEERKHMCSVAIIKSLGLCPELFSALFADFADKKGWEMIFFGA